MTISFSILDNCKHTYGPIHKFVNSEINYTTVLEIVTNILSNFSKTDDPSSYYYKLINEDEIEKITWNLIFQNYYVINEFNRYYVIAFALNFTRFEIFSKDCATQLITWRLNDKKNIIIDDNSTLNSVIESLKQAGIYFIDNRTSNK